MVSNDKLLEYNRLGFIPGPEETKREFLARIDYCLELSSQLPLFFGKVTPESVERKEELYDLSPSWVPLIFDNKHLAPWHGGCTWIFQQQEGEPTGVVLQLRKAFRYKKWYLGIYSREELIGHELSHVGRMMFNEPQFEEFLAYQSSPSALRRWAGSIVRSTKESVFFLSSLALVVIVDLSALMTNLTYLPWVKLLPLGLLLYGVVRLWKDRKVFSRCLSHLEALSGSRKKALAILYRLTDWEIIHFSQCSPKQICGYIEEQVSMRWKVIRLAYPFHFPS